MFVLTSEKLPIKVWDEVPAGDPLLVLKDKVFEQARNLANLPVARKWVCLMPDYHLGYGMPIGGVLATSHAVVPNAVGVDIGCGMIAVRTSLDAEAFDQEALQQLREAVHRRVPVGKSRHQQPHELPTTVPTEFSSVISGLLPIAHASIGTLGGGNHFIEFQKDSIGNLWIMLHSGSRQVGLKVCNHYQKIAKRYMERFGVELPDPDLAFLPDIVPEYQQYMEDMQWCMAFAEANRVVMLEAVYAAFGELGWPDLGIDLSVDTHHNFAAVEHHYGENLVIHRKGAVKAEGLVTIPGSMGTSSYICKGLTPAESFNTCAHGAGRAMGRKEANRTITHEQAVEQMKDVVYGVRKGDYDEMPTAYKDVDVVVASMPDLVEPKYRLTPLAVVKG